MTQYLEGALPSCARRAAATAALPMIFWSWPEVEVSSTSGTADQAERHTYRVLERRADLV